ncbi:MAG: 30S ribosomal protein S13 [Candidatus Saccharimonadales bacterium]
MARIAAVNIPDDKRVIVALTYVYGIGNSSAKKILATAKVDENTRVKDLSESELSKIREIIDKDYEVEGDLAQRVRVSINRLREINSYRGGRHKANLPVRGQRTKTNARTKRGKRIAVGGSKQKTPTAT